MRKIRHFSGNIWSTFVTVLWCSKTKITEGTILFLVRYDFEIYWQFWYSFFKTAVVSSNNFYPIEITWRKMVHSVCLIPVSMGMWCLLTSWHFTLPVYELHKAMNFNFVQVFMPACKWSGRPGVRTPKIAVGRPELHSRSSVGRPDLLPLNLSMTLRTFSTCFEVHQPSN